MADKDVQRNVRSSSEEGVQTPKQKHYHLPGEKDNFPLDKPHHEKVEKKSLLKKFRKREKEWTKEKAKTKSAEKV